MNKLFDRRRPARIYPINLRHQNTPRDQFDYSSAVVYRQATNDFHSRDWHFWQKQLHMRR